MKIVQWDDDTVPEVVAVNEHGDTLIQDSMFEFDLEKGDLVQYITEIGTSLYFVDEVQPIEVNFDGYADSTNIVTLVGAM